MAKNRRKARTLIFRTPQGRGGRAVRAQCSGERRVVLCLNMRSLVQTQPQALFSRVAESGSESNNSSIYILTSRGPDPPHTPPNQECRGAPLHPSDMQPPNRCTSELKCFLRGTFRALHHEGLGGQKQKKSTHSHFPDCRFPRAPVLGSLQDFPGSSVGVERNRLM